MGMPPMVPSARPARPRSRVRRIIAVVVMLGVTAAILVSCNQMAIASVGTGARVKEVVGDAGEVTTLVIERNINVTPQCHFRVRLREGLAAETAERVLARVWASTGDSPCEVRSVEFGNRSVVHGSRGTPVDAAGAAAVVAAADAIPGVSLSLDRADEVRGVFASVYEREGDRAATADLLRDAASVSAALEDAFGPVAWSVEWVGDGILSNTVSIQADAPELPAFASVVDGLASLQESGELGTSSATSEADLDAAITGVSLTAVFVGGDEAIGVALSVEGWNKADLEGQQAAFAADSRAAAVAASIARIIEGSGLPRPSITANSAIELGAPDA